MAEHDAVGALSCVEGIDPDDLVNPWHAAWASFFSFILGAALPVASILLFPPGLRIPATFVAVLFALPYLAERYGWKRFRPRLVDRNSEDPCAPGGEGTKGQARGPAPPVRCERKGMP